MIVSYPMYALPQMQDSLKQWWASLCQRLGEQGISAPKSVFEPQGDLIQHWLRSDLLLSQTCGLPLVSQLKTQVKLVGTPVFAAPACEGSNYCSFYIVQKNESKVELEDFQGMRFAYNGTDSQSGFNAARMNLIEQGLPIPFFGKNILSGGHRNSILMVGKGEADICAVDCVTYSLLEMHQPDTLANTRILAQTRKTPGLPLITCVETDDEIVDVLFKLISQACDDESLAKYNFDLQLKGIEKIALEAYYQTIFQPDYPIEKL